MDFLLQNPENWLNIDSHIKAKNILQHLNVINVKLSYVKLMEYFNTEFTQN